MCIHVVKHMQVRAYLYCLSKTTIYSTMASSNSYSIGNCCTVVIVSYVKHRPDATSTAAAAVSPLLPLLSMQQPAPVYMHSVCCNGMHQAKK
jgi:hypothetical protein